MTAHTHPHDLHLRPAVPADAEWIVALDAQQEPEAQPLTVDAYRQDADETRAAGERWVAEREGRALGFAGFSHAWWTGEDTAYMVQIRVDDESRRHSIGTALLDLLLPRLLERGATRLLGEVREDRPDSVNFARRHGFQPSGRVYQDYRLDLAEANTDAYAGREEALRQQGIEIATLAEIGVSENLLHEVQRLWHESGSPAPGSAQLEASFDTWRQQVVEGPGLSPDTHWLALHDGRPVGMTFLKLLGSDAAENDYTGVLPAYRGRGIAPVLKLRAIAWGQQHGLRFFYTGSEVGNAAMIGVNTRLGYRPGARRIQLVRHLSGDTKRDGE